MTLSKTCGHLVATIGLAVLLLDSTAHLLAARLQGSPESLPQFEAASVKPNKSVGRVAIAMPPGGRLDATNVPLRMLIKFAYALQDFQLVGGPGWVSSERFDIVAKGDGDAAAVAPGAVGGTQLMLQELLASRFKLAVHPEQRELPIYALVLAQRDGRLGPRLRRSSVDCRTTQCEFRIGPGQLTAIGFPLVELAASLSESAGRLVTDQTGLAGAFDLELTWTPDQTTAGDQKFAGAEPPVPSDPDRPTLFTALREQLGLQLEATRGPVDVLVIDHVEAPTSD